MKIIFMGTPDFAVPCLKALIDSAHEVIAVYTQPDKPKGRGHKMQYTPVKAIALENSISVFQPTKLKTDEVKAQIKDFNADFIVVVAYGKLLPMEILEAPKYGSINVHASLLPKYRGAGPIQWAVLNGETRTGVTTMFMGEGLDTGDMLLTAETDIGENETASELYYRLSFLGAPILLETINRIIDGTAVRIKQDDSKTCYAPVLTKELCTVSFEKTANLVHNQIRGLSTWPCATVMLDGKKLKLYKSEIVGANGYEKVIAGAVLDNKKFIVGCGENTAIKLVEVQLDGSKRMNGEDFLRGKKIAIGTTIE